MTVNKALLALALAYALAAVEQDGTDAVDVDTGMDGG